MTDIVVCTGEHGEKPSIASPESGAAVTEAGADELRKFLIDHNLGVDCSGFATHILRAHFLETKGVDITKNSLKIFPLRGGVKLLCACGRWKALGCAAAMLTTKIRKN